MQDNNWLYHFLGSDEVVDLWGEWRNFYRRLPRAIRGMILAGCILIVYWVFAVLGNPLLIFSHDPTAIVLLDGQRIRFNKGVFWLTPWSYSYELEVRSARGNERWKLFPWGADSGSVSIDEGSTEISMPHRKLD